ncbi:autotransporter assembly complex protein TamA [Falsiroseomonas oryzae]|uniref:autotransporter assembly complex protein TamA n=1 Tax=Falsiroseomonas oryzae TaxID=2766473 RepID=UPI0022EADC72|nr:autotransporter assembly complex family protein [Roseomonas sp. MO-31]
MRSLSARFHILLLVLLAAAPAAAQDATLPYATTLVPTGEERLDRELAEASQLRALAGEAPVDAFGLIARAEAEPRRLEEVLRAEGWWGGRVEITLAGMPLGTPGLAERLAAAPPGEVRVEVRVIPGTRYTLRNIALRPAEQADAPTVAALGTPGGIARGDPASAGPVLDAEAALIERLRREGHPLAAIADREVIVDHEAQAMDVTWTVSPGPRASFATPEVEGETRVNRALLDRVAGRMTGEPYSPARLERGRRDLMALGAFDGVRARAGTRLDQAGRLPVTFTVNDRPRNAAGITLAYETVYGPSGRVFYERRNVFGNAELLRLEAEVSRLGTGGGTADTNWRIAASFRRPALLDGRTSLVADAALVRERLEAYDRDAFVATVLLERPFGDRWLLRAGPTFETGRIGRDGNLEPYTLAGLVFGGRYDDTDSLLDPRRGIRADANVIPYADLAEGGGFVRALGTFRTYFDVTGDGGSVIALRGTLGSLLGADGSVPLDKRFYAGGGGSVRGYPYQGIGPRDAQNRPLGGSSLVEGSVELRQRVSGPIGVVGFVDAGAVGQSEAPDFGDVRVGAGLGLRYGTAIGPLRLDVAVPMSRLPGDPGYGVYVGLGQSF